MYRLLWMLLKDLNVWGDEEYLQRKKAQTFRDDRCDIIAKCIITVSGITNKVVKSTNKQEMLSDKRI